MEFLTEEEARLAIGYAKQMSEVYREQRWTELRKAALFGWAEHSPFLPQIDNICGFHCPAVGSCLPHRDLLT